MRRIIVAILLSVPPIVACTNTSSQSNLPETDFFVAAGQAFLMRFGDTAGVTTPTQLVTVRFTTVLDDSRCPENVTCVTAGEANVILTLQTSLALTDVRMAIPPSGEAEVVVEGISIEAITLRPAAMDGVVINPVDYTIGIRVREVTVTPLPN